ncbi:MAG TPA: energy transducer TonB [Blastocatellia bacterium]|nr:energy transducer TonB [Blastocatellia bacterium]
MTTKPGAPGGIASPGTLGPEPPLFGSIEATNLVSRLWAEVLIAVTELAHDPRQFVVYSLQSTSPDPKRRRRLTGGLAGAFLAYLALITTISIIGWRKVFLPKPDSGRGNKITWVVAQIPQAYGGDGIGTSPEQGSGGTRGGGGQQDIHPVVKGIPPPPSLGPQIVRPNPSMVENPDLAIPTTVLGVGPPPPPGPIGLPSGAEGSSSMGPGKGGGLGTGEGTGAGGGKGAGAGPGNGGGPGRGSGGSPNGSGGGNPVYDWRFVQNKDGFQRFTWIYRPRPVITPEAIQNKSNGTVLVRATFNPDGTITDIRIVNPVDFMTESAIESLKHSKFRPATFDGVPITLRNVLVKIEVDVTS